MFGQKEKKEFEQPPRFEVVHESYGATNDGRQGNFFIIKDLETGVSYLKNTGSQGDWAITPLIDSEGKIAIEKTVKEN